MKPNPLSTANAAFIISLLAATRVAEYQADGQLRHGLITTANTSLFNQAHFSEPLTTYALGWRDPAQYDALSDFIAPPLLTGGERYEHIEYPNAEAFLSDEAHNDLRAIGADFLTVDYTESKTERTIPNRGLRMVLDYDLIKTKPGWQTFYTDRLMQRLARNAYRRKVALALAAGTAVSLAWGGSADPDLDLATQLKLSGDTSGISPNRAIWGLGAKLLRFGSYGSQSDAAAFAGRSLSPEEASSKIGLGSMVDDSRYQTGATKTSILGSKIVFFNAYSQSGEDPSNFKTARGTTQQGGRWGVYLRQMSPKFWELVVECYETEFCASVLGVRTITVS